MRRWLALIDEALGQATRQPLGGVLCVVAVIAFALPGQHHVQDVMAVVVPLRVEVTPQVVRDVAVMLEHQMDVAAVLDGRAHLCGHLIKPVAFGDGVDGIEAQPVEAILHQPVERILGEELSHFGATEIDRRRPMAF